MKMITVSLLLMLAAISSAQAQRENRGRGGFRPNEPIVAATFNIRMNNPDDGANAWPHRAAWVRELVRFHEWDIFGTQEGFRGQLDDLLQMDEFAQIGVGREDGEKKGEHSAIFYRRARFELLDNGDFWLSETPERPGAGWDARIFRICSWGKFRDRFSGREFYFFCAHYDHQGAVARLESSKLIVKKIAEITGGGTPTILVGDMNSTPDSDAYAVLDANLRDSYKTTLMPPYGPVGTFQGFDWQREVGGNRIDYIFTTPDVEVVKYGVLTDSRDRRYPSDHFPVVTKLVIR